MFMLGVVISVQAEDEIKETLPMIPSASIPLHNGVNGFEKYCYGITDLTNLIPGREYEDFQLQTYTPADQNEELFLMLCTKIYIPSDNYILAFVEYSGAIDAGTGYLISLDNNCDVVDQLEVAVYNGSMMAKQFRIDRDGRITVTRLVPDDTNPVLFTKFVEMDGHRVDETFIVDSNGKFVKQGEEKFASKHYSYEMLDMKHGKNLWDF